MSYGMPYYHLQRAIGLFLLAKKYIGLYVPSPVIEEHMKELQDYKTAKGTVQLPLDKKIPVSLVKKLVKARAKKNNESSEKG